MGDWKSQAPAALALPSYVDANDQKRAQSVGLSPFSAAGVQPFPILHPESLLSPHDPGFLDGASSLARFGLDVGGTLCKVVYFEPAVNGTKDSSRAWKQSKFAGFTDRAENGNLDKEISKPDGTVERTHVNGDSQQPRGGRSAGSSLKKTLDKERNGYVGNGIDREATIVRVNDGNAEELMTDGVDRLTITNEVTTITPRVHIAASVHADSDPKGKSANGKTSEAVSENFQCSGDKPGVQVQDDRSSGASSFGEVEKDSHKQVKKIWVSSHEPVHLPGRGMLYFKCFGTF